MKQKTQSSETEQKTTDDAGILINDIKYSYSITKSERKEKEDEEESLLIKLYVPNEKSNMYFTYEAPKSQIIKDFKFLAGCESLDEMIISLKNIFSQGNAKVEEKEGEYDMELKMSDITKTCLVRLTKNEIQKEKESEKDLGSKIDKLEKEYKILLNKFEELKTKKESVIKEADIKNIVKEIIFDKDIKLKLFEEMEQILLAKYNFNNLPKSNDVQNEIINKIQNEVNVKEQKINEQIINIEKQLKQNVEYLKNLKTNDNNYILLQVKIEENDLNKDVLLFKQSRTNKYLYNFEIDDIETLINDQIVPIKFKDSRDEFKCKEKTKNFEKSQLIEYNLGIMYDFFWNFSKTGIYNVKIIFKKKLNICNFLFCDCNNIYKIDCSNFDCSLITDCSFMFSGCRSAVEINLGELDFSLSNNFGEMFTNCNNLEKLDVSKLNTQNSIDFFSMFAYCRKLKEINVSNFKTTNAKTIGTMFKRCENLESIDMINWDMKNISDIKELFQGCKSLKNIKMNFNNEKVNFGKDDKIFEGLPESGSFVWKKGANIDKLLSLLQAGWSRTPE